MLKTTNKKPPNSSANIFKNLQFDFINYQVPKALQALLSTLPNFFLWQYALAKN
jgi:hypothetical protein